MIGTGRKKSIAFFISLGAGLIVVTLLLYIGGVVLDWHRGIKLILGILLLAVIVAGVVLNTTFLVREIRRNEQHDAFINAVTHELKTPIASIRLYVETLQTRSVDESKRREFYRIILQDSDRLLSTIEQILRTGRIGSSRRPANVSSVNLNDVVSQSVQRAMVLHHLAPEAIEYQPLATAEGEKLRILGDLDEVSAAVSNLLDNAVKYSGSNAKVMVRTSRDDGRFACVRVIDNGPGIPGTELKRIFRRFYRMSGPLATRVKGTGLGLFIVRSVALRHGGRAWAESAGPGRGSTFVLQFPWKGESAMKRILIVEDEQHLADGLRFNLEQEGYEVEVLETGEAALGLLIGEKRVEFDAVVLDVMLPGKSGFEVMAEMRQAQQYVPTLILTARGHSADVLQGFSAGADDYLVKPFELDILIARIHGLLRRREWLRGAPEPAPRQPDDRFTFGDKSVYFDLLELRVRDQIFPLTLMEMNVLRHLIAHAGRPVSRGQMLEEVWGLREDTDTRALDNFIVRLRRYIEDDPVKPKHLVTVRGVGYRFEAFPR